MEVVVTTGTKWRAKLQSNCHHQQTNTQLFPAGCPSRRQIISAMVSKHWKKTIQTVTKSKAKIQD